MAELHLSDRSISYHLLTGRPCLPHLFFLHEGLGCSAMWHDFPQKLCRLTGCPGLLYDRRGHGGSSALQKGRTIDYVHDCALDELPRVLEALIPAAPFVLIGHSDGGSIGLIYAARQPPQLRGLITEAAHVFVEPETTAGIRTAQRAFANGRLHRLAGYHGDKTAALFAAWADTWLSDWFGSWNIENLLPSIRCPLLVIQGKLDEYGTSGQVAAIAAGTGHAETAIIPGCGHAPHREREETVLGLMAGFLARRCL